MTPLEVTVTTDGAVLVREPGQRWTKVGRLGSFVRADERHPGARSQAHEPDRAAEVMAMHTHVWTHENQEPLNPAHHHGFGERVLRPTERIVDLDARPAETYEGEVRWYHLDDDCWMTPDAAERRALEVLAAVDHLKRGKA